MAEWVKDRMAKEVRLVWGVKVLVAVMAREYME